VGERPLSRTRDVQRPGELRLVIRFADHLLFPSFAWVLGSRQASELCNLRSRGTMRGEYFYGHITNDARKRPAKVLRPLERRGVPESGRIVKLSVGQGHGFIRMANDRDVYFHRSDVLGGASINDFTIGDPVEFERLDDTVSGARALRVRRRSS
jgi:cold shock CspA family protein